LAPDAPGEFLGPRDDSAPGTPHIAEPVRVLVLDLLADELGALGACPVFDDGSDVVESLDRQLTR